MDVVVPPQEENAERLIRALDAFGFGTVGLQACHFMQDATVVLGRAPHEIDIMTYIKGVDIQQAWARRVSGILDTVPVNYIGKTDLLANKQAVGRPEDLADIARLKTV